MSDIKITLAEEKDVPLILGFVKELAVYEKLLHEVVATEDQIHMALFGEKAHTKCLLAYSGEQAVGFALFFYNYSTFIGKPGIYLEDLFVKPDHRGQGFGKALLIKLAQIALEEDCGRLEWSVLNWNQPSIDFYKSIGAKFMDEWTVCRVTGENIQKLAES